ncbi:MAG: seg [Candidatus Nomurabacteria bacterium]|nr:seg [Candidatus Nomurabacteria bacterium]
MQFKVPQFIDIEDKVFGPLTFKQFAYLAGGAGLGYLAFRFLPTIIAIVVGPLLVAFALALAFMKYNDKPFVNVVESFIRYYSHSRLYLWHKQPSGNVTTARPRDDMPQLIAHTGQGRDTMNESKLKTLSWSVDVIDPKK